VVIGKAMRCSRGKSTLAVPPLRLESGETIRDRQETWCASVHVLQALVAERSIELWRLSFA
jgi:hypothetical protein